jgi:hypothetical protein
MGLRAVVVSLGVRVPEHAPPVIVTRKVKAAAVSLSVMFDTEGEILFNCASRGMRELGNGAWLRFGGPIDIPGSIIE